MSAPPETSLVKGSARGLCPRCASPTLFDGWIAFAPRCRVCGLDFGGFDVGDGPAAFLTFFIGTIIVVLAIWLELAAGPPLWVHALLWLPLATIGTIGGLRLAKAALLWSEYRQRVRGQPAEPPPGEGE